MEGTSIQDGERHPSKEFQLNFWITTRLTSMAKMQKHLRNLKGEESAIGELLDKWSIAIWYQAFFNDIIKCDVIDNNMRDI